MNYKNASLPIPEQVEDLLGHITLMVKLSVTVTNAGSRDKVWVGSDSTAALEAKLRVEAAA